ncbi:MAG: polysaccharide export protein EpsE [Gammaproteobacteria bacterium]
MLNRFFVVFLFLTTLGFMPAPALAKDYVLGAGDVVRITVYEHTDLSTLTRISQTGGISFPLIGEVFIAGMKEREAEAKIGALLQQGGFVKSPQVNLIVEQYRSQQVSVLGEVNKPGMYTIDRGSKVVDLLAMAGGVNASGGDAAVLIKKNGSEGIGGRPIDLLALLQKGDMTQNMEVTDGDIVYVPRMEVFYIYGEVQRPGSYRLQRDMTVMQALSMGGGLTQRGTQRGIQIKRKDAKGALTSISAELFDVLRPDDVVYVKESLF